MSTHSEDILSCKTQRARDCNGTPVALPRRECWGEVAKPQDNAQPRTSVKLSVIAPTYNESENVAELIKALESALQHIAYEIVISDDDSPDRTWVRVVEIGREDPRVRVLRRTSNRGLGPAVLDGFGIARGEAVACIDADLQHDPSILPRMLQALEEGADLVVGSRYVCGGGTANWGWHRRFTSWTATILAKWLLSLRLHDPMSGYFMLRRADFLRVRPQLRSSGFKILLEIAARLQPEHICEVPYTFSPRRAGTSKLSSKVMLAYIGQLWRLCRPSPPGESTPASPAQDGAEMVTPQAQSRVA